MTLYTNSPVETALHLAETQRNNALADLATAGESIAIQALSIRLLKAEVDLLKAQLHDAKEQAARDSRTIERLAHE